MKNCTICGKPVVLVPSAQERADKYKDHPASYYTNLFPNHIKCELKKRTEDTLELMRRKNKEK